MRLKGSKERNQKRINVLESISARYWRDREYWTPKCNAIAIQANELQELLTNEVNVITASQWNETISYKNEHSWGKATCNGNSYILEGPEKELQPL